MSLVNETEAWFIASNQVVENAQPDVHRTAVLIGMQLEELGKKIAVLSAPMGQWMRQYGLMFRGGECDQLVRETIADPKRLATLLKADIQVIWQTIGAALALGAHTEEAYKAEIEAKWKLEHSDGQFHIDLKGEAEKPADWVEPDYGKYL